MSSPIDSYSQQVAEMIVDANEENELAINSFVNENYTYYIKNNNVTPYNEKNNSHTNWIYITQKSKETNINYDLIKYKLYRTNESQPRLYVLKDNMRIYISTNVTPDYESILKEINFMVEENFKDKKSSYEIKYEREKKKIEEKLKKIEIKLNIEREKRNLDKEDYELKCIEEYSNENFNFKQTFEFMTFRKENKNTKDKEESKSTKSDTTNEIIDHKAFEFVSNETNRVHYYTNIRGVKTITSDIYKTKIPCPFNCVSHLRATVEGSRREMLKQCRKNPNSQWCIKACKNNYKPTEEELDAYYEKFKK